MHTCIKLKTFIKQFSLLQRGEGLLILTQGCVFIDFFFPRERERKRGEGREGEGAGETDVRNINQLPPVPGLEPTPRVCALTGN